jgi:hypothetical protein
MKQRRQFDTYGLVAMATISVNQTPNPSPSYVQAPQGNLIRGEMRVSQVMRGIFLEIRLQS